MQSPRNGQFVGKRSSGSIEQLSGPKCCVNRLSCVVISRESSKRICTPPSPPKLLMTDRAHLYGHQSRPSFVKRESSPALLSHSPPLRFGTRNTAGQPFAFSLQMPHPSSSATWDASQAYASPTMAHPHFTLAQDDYDDGDELGELISVSGPANGSGASDRQVRRRSSKGAMCHSILTFCMAHHRRPHLARFHTVDHLLFLVVAIAVKPAKTPNYPDLIACDQCRKSKCKCERSAPGEPCKACIMLGTRA